MIATLKVQFRHACAHAVALCSIAMAIPASAQVTQPLQQAAQALAALPLASYASGEAMLQQALSNLKLDVKFVFLNKDYENDKYVRDPITGKKVRVACVRFKADSGFQFTVDRPTYSLTTQGLTVSQNVAKIRADGLAFKFMVGPCAWVGAGLGLQLTDVKFVYKAKPMLSFDDQGFCKLAWNNDPNSLSVAIGDLNVIGVQNDIDKLAKDATREALNATFDAMLGSALRGELQKVVISTCGSSKKR
ncbi:MAG: hypothetical protein ACT4UQ_08335 [Gammaproteobacteria bacterium]